MFSGLLKHSNEGSFCDLFLSSSSRASVLSACVPLFLWLLLHICVSKGPLIGESSTLPLYALVANFTLQGFILDCILA